MQPTPIPKIFSNLQALRFIAAVSVAVFHAEFFYRRAGGMWVVDPLRIGYVRIDLFFVISGFVTAHVAGTMRRPREAVSFLLRRSARIFSNYWPVMVAMIVIVAAFEPAVLTRYDYLRSTLLVDVAMRERVIPVTWTLTRELIFYILFALACLAPRGSVPWLVAALLALIASNQFLSPPYRSNVLLSPLTLEFLAGVGVRLILPHLHWRSGWTAFIASVVVLFGCGYLCRQIGVSHLSRSLIVGPAAALVVLTAAKLELGGRVAPAWLSARGDHAYSLYLVHWPILTLAKYMLEPTLRANPWCVEMVYGGVIASCIGYAAVHSRYVERPLYRIATNWLRQRPLGAVGWPWRPVTFSGAVRVPRPVPSMPLDSPAPPN